MCLTKYLDINECFCVFAGVGIPCAAFYLAIPDDGSLELKRACSLSRDVRNE